MCRRLCALVSEPVPVSKQAADPTAGAKVAADIMPLGRRTDCGDARFAGVELAVSATDLEACVQVSGLTMRHLAWSAGPRRQEGGLYAGCLKLRVRFHCRPAASVRRDSRSWS